MLTRYCTTRAEEIGKRKWRFIISDETIDRYRTVLKMNGWILENYEKNGVVFYQHNSWSSDPDNLIAKGIAFVDKNLLIGECELEPEGSNEKADKIQAKLKFGSINATSVGFDPLQYSKGVEEHGEDPDILYFRKQDLLEWSIVNIPANPNAVGKSADPYEEFVRNVRMNSGAPPPPPPPQEEETADPVGPDPHKSRLIKLKRNAL